MSTVLVTGGTGSLGRPLVRALADQGHDVRVLSRSKGTHCGDLSTGEGVKEAASGAATVVHAASDTRRFGRADPAQTQNLLDAIDADTHLIYVSIVGIDKIPMPYYKKKLECERLITARHPNHTIQRATQFHELLAMLMHFVRKLPVAPLPTDFKFQVMAAADCAERIASLVDREPSGFAPDTGGPEVLTLAEIAETWRIRNPKPRRVARIPFPGAIGRGFKAGLNTCPDHRDGTQTWAEFVAAGA